MVNTGTQPEDNLYLLSFIDCADRLDILLLEIRHLQQSIVHYLRAPTLYLPLRYEEKYIFGENWNDFFREGSTIAFDIKLVKNWIVRYPTPNSAVRAYSKRSSEQENGDLRQQIKDAVKRNVGQIWMGDNWARDQRAQYLALYALQLLKQRILRDKVAIYRAALQADLICSLSNKRTLHLDKEAFMILRQAVLDNAQGYVSILSNHKQQVSQSIDFGMPSDPHPSTERRREMGIFMDYLSNRTQSIQKDILHLLTFFQLKNNEEDNISDILMFHGWSQNARVTNFHLFDKTNYLYNKYRQGEKPRVKRHVGYVNTSFWTPDRPDLHSIIAHEVAASVNKNVLGGIDDVALSNGTDNYTQLLINLKSVLFEHASNNKDMAFVKDQAHHFIQEIASDFLAASVKGVSYLYSLFLLRIGDSLHSQLEVGGFSKLDMVYSLKEGTASFDDSLLGYLRMRLTTAWVEEVMKDKLSDLDKIVTTGTRNIADQLLLFLDDHAPQTRNKRAHHWQTLAEEMIQQIKESNAVKNSRKWRIQRTSDDWVETCGKAGKAGKRRFSRTTRRLNVRLQNYLFRELLAQKRSVGKPLHGVPFERLEETFDRIYPLEISDVGIPYVDHPRSTRHPILLFRHMYDIPYQAAVIRSVDIFYSKPTTEHFFEQLRWDMELGRGLFSIALEFHARETGSPEHRLALCINQIAYLYQQLSDSTLKQSLKDWLSLESKEKINTDKKPFNYKKHLSRRRVQQLCNKISSINANEINKTFSFFKSIHAREIRSLEELAGYKLQELLGIIESHVNTVNNPVVNNQLHVLIQFLSIRRVISTDKKAQPKTDFYNHLLAAMGDISVERKIKYEEDNQIREEYLPTKVPSVMIHRLSVTNFHPVPDPVHLNYSQNQAFHNNQNGMVLSDCLQMDRWKVLYGTPGKAKSVSNTWVVLGRFDAITLIEVRLPCKCYLQGFTDEMELPSKTSSRKTSLLDDKTINEDIEKQIKEAFPPHFSRREIAHPVIIIDTHSKTNKHHQVMDHMREHLFAMLGVTLQRRSMRLDFLYRLIKALNTDSSDPDGLSRYYSNLEKRIIALKAQEILVIAFLTDGWGDVLFTFRKDKEMSEKDLNTIF